MELSELRERQSWSLQKKIDHALFTIETFLARTDGKAYVAFSGGKDSTCLLDLCRIIKPDIKACFVNTGNEYPDIVRFVRGLKEKGYNIDIIHPKVNPRQVMERYGFPLISKEQSEYIGRVKKNPNTKSAKRAMGLLDDGKFLGVVSKRWRFLIEEPYMVSNKCCEKLKKNPSAEYQKKTGMSPILGVMACESKLRETTYLSRGGCNVFGEGNRKTESFPLSIWMEQDVWDYIKLRKLEIADIYHKGADRTGCMFCGYGCQFAGDNRFKLCYDLYPKIYNIFMNYTNNGHTYREALRKVLAKNDLYLPDEEPNIFKPNEDGTYDI